LATNQLRSLNSRTTTKHLISHQHAITEIPYLADSNDEAPPTKKLATNEDYKGDRESSEGLNAQASEEIEEDDEAPTPEHISMALCSMLSGNHFGHLPMRLPPNFFMNPSLVASQLQCMFKKGVFF
jgi:hypothetical protein